MDFGVYISKWVKIDISSGYYYEGIVLEADDFFLKLKDKRGNLVSLSNQSIISIREVSR